MSESITEHQSHGLRFTISVYGCDSTDAKKAHDVIANLLNSLPRDAVEYLHRLGVAWLADETGTIEHPIAYRAIEDLAHVHCTLGYARPHDVRVNLSAA